MREVTERIHANILDFIITVPVTIGGAALCLLVLWGLGVWALTALGLSDSVRALIIAALTIIAIGLLAAFAVIFLSRYFRGELTRSRKKQVAAIYNYRCNVCGYRWHWDSRMPPGLGQP